MHRWIDGLARTWLEPPDLPRVDFAQPRGEEALVGPHSVSWRVFKNLVALLVGGMAAVILELAEPRVRTGVWEHSSFRSDPVRRLQRTGLAATTTVYGARSVAEPMIAGIVRRHGAVSGTVPGGEAYHAGDPDLLTWVHATAAFGFVEAYHRYVRPLGPEAFDRFYAEGVPAARLYGALHAPASSAGLHALFASMRGRLEPSPVIFEFLEIMRAGPILPARVRPAQRVLVGAAVVLVPGWVRVRVGLTAAYGLGGWEALVRQLGSFSDRIVLRSGPAAQSCLRLGLPADYLYRL